MRLLVIRLLTLLILLQSQIAAADVHQPHQDIDNYSSAISVLPINTDLKFLMPASDKTTAQHKHHADISSEKAELQTRFVNLESPTDCLHCCHCHNSSHQWLGGHSISLLNSSLPEALSKYRLQFVTRILSPELRPPIS